MSIWKNFGFNMVIFVAGLQAIPERLYEAASLDGAGPWRQFRHVTLPMLAPTALFVAVMTMIGDFQLFAEPYVMTPGRAVERTLSVVLLMFQEGFRFWNMGYAAAIAFVLFAILLAGTALQLKLRPLGGGRDVMRLARSLLLHAALIAAALLTLLPLAWMVAASLMPAGGSSDLLANLRSGSLTLEHYATLFTRLDLARTLANSAGLAATVTVISVFVNALAGYAFAKLRFAGRDRLFRVPRRDAGDPRPARHAAALPAA